VGLAVLLCLLLVGSGIAVMAIGGSETTMVVGIGLLVAGCLAPIVVLVRGGAREAAREQRFRATGIAGSARILTVKETGLTVNDAPQVDMTLEVQVQGGHPYQVQHRTMVPRLMIGRLTDGRPLKVLIDPVDPKQVSVDWMPAEPAVSG
jgi:hypothetical protein